MSSLERDVAIVANGSDLPIGVVYTGAGDGRYIFTLRNRRVVSVGNVGDDICTSFDLDVIDLFLSKRTRIEGVGGLFGVGARLSFTMYALDTNTLVLLDYNVNQRVLRQSLVQIDLEKETAHCHLYRTYSVRNQQGIFQYTVGETTVVVVDRNDGCIIPRDPLSPTAHRDISPLMTQGLGFLTKSFTDEEIGQYHWFRLKTAIVMDLRTGTICIRQINYSDTTPFTPFDRAFWGQINDREIAISSSNDGETYFIGVLNTVTLTWTRIEGQSFRRAISYRMITSPENGHFAMMEWTVDVGGDRVIGRVENGVEAERFFILRHPRSVSSLARLASIALQKSGLASSELLRLIDDRLC